MWRRARFSRSSRRSFPRITADLALQPNDVDELVGLATQLLSDHRRLRRDGGHDDHAHAAPLHRLDERTEVAVAGEQHHLVDVWRDLYGVDCELNIHVAFDLALSALIDEFFRRLGDHRVAIVIEP